MKERILSSIRDSITAKQALLAAQPDAIEKAAQLTIDCLKNGGKILFFGNGGSASDSQHMAAEFTGRYEKERRPLAAVALSTDTSALTAIGNDYGFDRVFERQVGALGRKGDVAFGISTSGNSKNVVLGIRKARELGLKTVGLLGRDGGELKGLVDVPIVVNAPKTSRIQECHILIGHIICECVDEAFAS